MAKSVLYCFPSRSVTLFQNGSKPPKNSTLGNAKAQGLSALLTKIGLFSKYNISALSQDLFLISAEFLHLKYIGSLKACNKNSKWV